MTTRGQAYKVRSHLFIISSYLLTTSFQKEEEWTHTYIPPGLAPHYHLARNTRHHHPSLAQNAGVNYNEKNCRDKRMEDGVGVHRCAHYFLFSLTLLTT